MFKALKNAYYNGWRAGMTDPVLYVVNGQKYVSQPQCPYIKWQQLAVRWLWFAGKDNGQWRRMRVATRKQAF